jgi:YndJ-like protein
MQTSPKETSALSHSVEVANVAHVARVSALIGGTGWLILLFVPLQDLSGIVTVERLMLLGALVIVPLGLSLVAPTSDVRLELVSYRAAVFAQPFGAVMAVVSMYLQQRSTSGRMAAGWLAVTSLIAVHGMTRLISRRTAHLEELSIDASHVYVAVGGAWFVMSRFGWQPLGFGSAIVLLTAVHFHYAGFAAPLLAGLAGRFIGSRSPLARRAFVIAALCIVGGTPLVAAGITFSPLIGLIGTIVVATGLLFLAVLVVGWIVPALDSLTAKILLTVSSASAVSAMVLASAYAYSIVVGQLIISIPQMAVSHGITNALGFSLCGLLAWSLIRSSELQGKLR